MRVKLWTAIRNKNMGYLDKHCCDVIDSVIENPWVFYPDHTYIYERYLSYGDYNSQLRDTISTILKAPVSFSWYKDDLKSVLVFQIKPYILEYVANPTSFVGGITKDIFLDNTGYQTYQNFIAFYLLKGCNEHGFSLVRKLVHEGLLDINARTDGEDDIMNNLYTYMCQETVLVRLQMIKFLLDIGFDPVTMSRNIFDLLQNIVPFITDFSKEYYLICSLLSDLKSYKLSSRYSEFTITNPLFRIMLATHYL